MKTIHSWPVAAALALCLSDPVRLPAAEARPAVTPRAEGFPLSAVKLLDGPFRRAMEVDRAFLLRLDPDRLLAGFRREAGLPKKAEPYGGWEGIPDHGRWSLAGQGLGHYLSALSLMAAAAGDEACRRRADHIVDELAACQDAAGTGILCAFPESKAIFAEIAAGRIKSDKLFNLNGGYVPLYVTHKVMAGLRDAWLVLGNRKARDVLVRMADWLGTVLEKITDAQIQEMLETEHGGIMEAMADVGAIAGEERYLTLARRLNHRRIFEPLTRAEDRLTGQHANAQIPKAIGMERIHELTGDPDFGRAARFFWDDVVRNRSFVIGGHGENEFFFDPAAFPTLGVTSTTGPETCNTYNMLKLSRRLWCEEPAAAVADFIERALYNHILASQDPVHGGFVYFTSMRPGHYRVYSSDTDDFWCCLDTGMENHAKYGEFIFARSGDKLWVDLLVPSELDWAEQGVKVRLDTRFPEDGKAKLTFAAKEPRKLAIAVRCPGWLRPGSMGIAVNGAAEKVEARPGSYHVVERTWKTGDTLEVDWPPAIRTEFLPRSREWVAVLWGPVVLAGELGTAGLEKVDFNGSHNYVATEARPVEAVPVFVGSADDVAARLRPVPGRPMTFRTEGLASPSEVTLAPFYTVHGQRYAVYWKLSAPPAGGERPPAGNPAGEKRTAWSAIWEGGSADAAIRAIIGSIDPARMAKHLAYLAKDPLPFRKANYTLPGHPKSTLDEADDYIAGLLESWGYRVEREGLRVQAYRRDPTRRKHEQYSQPRPEDPWYAAHNLYAEKKGASRPDEIIVVCAHKDSQSWVDSPGAYDNAIGTVAVLEMARAIAGATTERTVRFLFCNEEHTPWTSAAAARKAKERGDRIVAVFNTDSLGGKSAEETAAKKMTNVTGYSEPAGERLAELMTAAIARYAPGLEGRVVKREFPNDDDGSFVKAGYPAAIVNVGSWPYADPNYHQEGDIPERCDVANAALAARAVLAAILTVDRER